MSVIKSYKGFNEDMTCRGKQYVEGETYKEDKAETCKCGMHACKYPLDCFQYYPPSSSVYHEVEQSGRISTQILDSKIASTEMKIGARLDIRNLVNAAIKYRRKNVIKENIHPKAAIADIHEAATARECGTATAGVYGVAIAGMYGTATAGAQGVAAVGDRGTATAGDNGAAAAGDWGTATARDCGAAAAGNCGAATAGNCGAATAGNYGTATAGAYGASTVGMRGMAIAGDSGMAIAGDRGIAIGRGRSSSGENGVSIARGNEVFVKGAIGAILVIAEENPYDYNIIDWKAVVVDGEKIKADTWYRLVDGELEEVRE